jgi:hypothetical protein
VKFRSDFVTNSSSTSFAAAIAEIAAALALSGIFSSCKCGEQNDYKIEISLYKNKITADSVDETWVNAKVTSSRMKKLEPTLPKLSLNQQVILENMFIFPASK